MLNRSTTVAGHRGSIVIIDDHSLIAAALRDLIAQYSHSATIHACGSLAQALSTLRFSEPDMVFIDLGLPDASGSAAVTAIRSAVPRACVAVISGNDEAAYAIPEVRNGTIPFVRKGMAQHEIGKAIHDLLRRCGLADGVRQCSDEGRSAASGRFANLSPRQRQIIRLLATGRSNNEIAESLHVSVETIKTHLHDIFAKLQVKNRTQAVLLYQSEQEEVSGGEGPVDLSVVPTDAG